MSPSLSSSQRPDLWSYACQRYPDHKTELLAVQEKGISVNDLLALSYARRFSLHMDDRVWNRLAFGRTRRVLERVRRFRLALSKASPLREQALRFELELERWDLHLLEQCLYPIEKWRHQWPPNFERLNSEDQKHLTGLMDNLSK